MKASKKIKRTLESRRDVYDNDSKSDKQGTKRPGSLSGAK